MGTAPRTYAARLTEQLLRKGGRAIWMPMITTEPLRRSPALDAALQAMASAGEGEGERPYDFVAFTSRNGIEACLGRASALGLATDMARLFSGCTVCALGRDAQALEDAGVAVGLLPTTSSPAGIIRELECRGADAVRGKRVLVPAPQVSGVPEPNVVPNFIAGLEALGLDVHRVPAYATEAVLSGNEVEEQLLLD